MSFCRFGRTGRKSFVTPEASSKQQWVVIIGKGSWSKCYGLFESYDDTTAWVKANQFSNGADDFDARPVNLVRNAKPEVSPMQDAESLSGVSTLGSSASPNTDTAKGPSEVPSSPDGAARALAGTVEQPEWTPQDERDWKRGQ